MRTQEDGSPALFPYRFDQNSRQCSGTEPAMRMGDSAVFSPLLLFPLGPLSPPAPGGILYDTLAGES